MKNYYYHSSQMSGWLFSTVIAGVAGGAAEIVWISLYSFYSPVSAMEVTRQISITIIPATVNTYYAPILGAFIHLLLSIVLAFVFAITILLPLSGRYGKTGIFLGSLITLAIVWKINFFIVLPLINVSFISLMPFYVTLISKLLFGMAMAWVLIVMQPLQDVTPCDAR